METEGKFSKKTENGRKSKTGIKVFAGALTITIAAAGFAVYDSTIDHVNEICPLCSIVGLVHQKNAINRYDSADGYFAMYKEPEQESIRTTLDGVVEVHEAVPEHVAVIKTDCTVLPDGTCIYDSYEVNRFYNDDIEPEITEPSR